MSATSPPPTVDWDALRSAAREVSDRAHAPYSGLRVGAAGIVDTGRVVTGCNVESASFGVTLCAECGLIGDFQRTGGGRLVAISCVDQDGRLLMPCGRCRQLLIELGGPELLVDHEPLPLTMAELLPGAFTAADLPGEAPAP